MPAIGLAGVYTLSDRDVRGAMVVQGSGGSLLDGRRRLRGLTSLHIPVAVEPALGEQPLDLVVGTDIATMLVSTAVVEALRSAGCTGWGTYPVEFRDGHRQRIDGYHGFSVHGRCGPLNPSDRREWQPPRVPGGPRYEAWVGLSFPSESWDGSDVFMANDETLFVFATERVRDAIRSAKLRNFEFRPIAEVKLLSPHLAGE
jgi:hypothetical protein